jgi:CHAT domain-containing protein/lipopolysaccharide biosynthesis regulator YciM
MKNVFFFLAFILPAQHGFSQNVDSLSVARTVDSLLIVSNNQWRAGKNEELLSLAQYAAGISKKAWGEHHIKYASSLFFQGVAFMNLGQVDKAEQVLLQSIDLQSKVLAREHPFYVQSLGVLGYLYTQKGDFLKAEKQFKEVLEIRAKVPGKQDPEYIAALGNLANVYMEEGDYTKAEPLYLEAREIAIKTLGKIHPGYATSVAHLATLYHLKCDYAKAEPLYLEARELRAKALGREDPEYAECLNNLGDMYIKTGNYAKAEPMLLEAVEIMAKTLGKKHPDYASYLSNLANLYERKGEYSKAESMLLEAREILAKNPGKKHPDYALCLEDLARIYFDKGNYSDAEALYLEAREILAMVLGKEHPEYTAALGNLAELYLAKSDYTKAEPLLSEVRDIYIKTLGKDHPDYAVCLAELAHLYYKNRNYVKAEPLIVEAIEIQSKILGREHKDYIESLVHLAIMYQETNRPAQATVFFLETGKLNRRLIERAAAYSSESQMLAYLYTFEGKTDQFKSFTQMYPSPDLNRASFDDALFFNGFLLENARHLAHSLTSADSLTHDSYDRWKGCQRRLANEYAKPFSERVKVAEVEAESETYEKTLISKLSAFGSTRQAPNWQQVRDQLSPGQAAIEFIHYQYYTPSPTDSILYAALVLRPGDTQPQFIPLFEEKELTGLLQGTSGGSNFLKINALYSRKQDKKPQKSLYELIWGPLESQLKGVNTVYCAPSGLLHRINLAAVTTPDGRVFGDQRQLVLLGSTRQLITQYPKAQNAGNDAYLAGGIRYDADSTAIAFANRGNSSRGFELSDAPEFQPDTTAGNRGGVLDYLPATASEVRTIGQMLTQANILAKVDTSFHATEEAFRQLGVDAHSPRIIHLATHGYFFPDPKKPGQKTGSTFSREPVFKMTDHPMMRSGLIMAGAKQAWLTGHHPVGTEDGILTAYEISQMNLSNTELVVLSACETGLGDIVGNEGVYGLQRAFKIAGVKYLVMSLWKVDDRNTQEFMTGFYRHWLTEKLTIPQAFRSMQQEMRTKHPSAYDWAGFVLIE